MSAVRINGRVKAKRDTFGFIRGADRIDRFFHRDDVGHDLFESLQDGDRVSFESVEHEKGPRAINVEPTP